MEYATQIAAFVIDELSRHWFIILVNLGLVAMGRWLFKWFENKELRRAEGRLMEEMAKLYEKTSEVHEAVSPVPPHQGSALSARSAADLHNSTLQAIKSLASYTNSVHEYAKALSEKIDLLYKR